MVRVIDKKPIFATNRIKQKKRNLQLLQAARRHPYEN